MPIDYTGQDPTPNIRNLDTAYRAVRHGEAWKLKPEGRELVLKPSLIDRFRRIFQEHNPSAQEVGQLYREYLHISSDVTDETIRNQKLFPPTIRLAQQTLLGAHFPPEKFAIDPEDVETLIRDFAIAPPALFPEKSVTPQQLALILQCVEVYSYASHLPHFSDALIGRIYLVGQAYADNLTKALPKTAEGLGAYLQVLDKLPFLLMNGQRKEWDPTTRAALAMNALLAIPHSPSSEITRLVRHLAEPLPADHPLRATLLKSQ